MDQIGYERASSAGITEGSDIGLGSSPNEKDKIVAELIAVVLLEIPMNYEFESLVRQRAKELIRNRSERKGEGPRLQNGDWEIAARIVAGICRQHLSFQECEEAIDRLFCRGQEIRAGLVRCASDGDYFEWLDVAARRKNK